MVVTTASHGHNAAGSVTYKNLEIIILHLHKLLQTCCQLQDTADTKLKKYS